MQHNTLNFSQEFSKRLEEVLDKRSQSYVAEKMNVSQNTVSAWLRGDIPKQFEALRLLAKEFDVDLHWLITGEIKEPDFDIPDEDMLQWLRKFAGEIKSMYKSNKKR